MKKTFKKFLALSLCFFMAVSLASCGAKEEKSAEKPDNAKEENAKTDGKKKRIALICDVAGTQVFVLDMIAGFNESAEKYGFEPIIAECPDSGAYEDNARALLEEGVDLLIGGGWQSAEVIQKMATEFPDKAAYAIIDSEVEAENVKCVSFREQEGAYLIGQIAAMVADEKSTTFGGVHVSQGPGSFKWRWGYMEGVKAIRPDAKFVFNYVGSYNDPAKSKEYAIQQFEQGCSFINAAAAGGDKGVFEAAKEKGFYTSGQDVDLTSPDNEWVLTCQIKDTRSTMVNLLDTYYSDNWNTDNVTWGVEEGTIGAVHVTHESKNPRSEKLTDENIAKLKEVVEKIKTKEIDLSIVPDESTYKQ